MSQKGEAGLHAKILVLDFGSQYTQLIARRIRELKFYTEIHPYSLKISEIKKINPSGIILSGGPSSVYDKKSPRPDKEIFNLGLPILGICYGLQLIADTFGGRVEAAALREYGKADLKNVKDSDLLSGINPGSQVWMSHGDKVKKLPTGFNGIASTSSSPYAVISHKSKPIFGLQFHPEVRHSLQGNRLLKNFCKVICKVKPNWTMKNFAHEQMQIIRETVKNERVLLGLSGGVDSTVTAKLLHDAIGDQLTCVYVDNGLMRKDETVALKIRFKDYFNIKLEVVNAEAVFLEALKGVSEPEQKRKIIGRLFIQEFNKRAKKLGHHEFLAQGTLYTDVIESVSVKGPSETIKSHHNRVKEVLELLKAGKVIEPLKELFKDEVRSLGLELEIPHEMLFRHPFPGPGLAIRILGDITGKKLSLLREADAILIDELKTSGHYARVWQAFTVLLPVQSVGVMGDKRTYENVAAIRVVESHDGMTADFARLPHEFLAKVSTRIINEVKGINRVVYDISSKPPATIEWE